MARKLHVSRSSVRERLPSFRCRDACKYEQSDAAHEGSNSCIILAPMKTVPIAKLNKTQQNTKCETRTAQMIHETQQYTKRD